MNPPDCVVIDDAPSGVLAAGLAGMSCVAVTNTHTREQLSRANLIVDHLDPGSIDSL
jgi:beta-phosphoglucomutase-like phosphatase (HAD superfamily)